MFVFMKVFQCFIKINNGHIFWGGLSLRSSTPDAELSEKCDQLLLVYIFGLTETARERALLPAFHAHLPLS